MTRGATPPLSDDGQRALEVYVAHLTGAADLRPATLRNYLSDLRQSSRRSRRAVARAIGR